MDSMKESGLGSHHNLQTAVTVATIHKRRGRYIYGCACVGDVLCMSEDNVVLSSVKEGVQIYSRTFIAFSLPHV